MRQAYAALGLLALLLVGCAQQPPYDAVCAIAMGDGTGGSGTLVGVSGDAALVLTCRHVASNDDEAELTWRSGFVSKGFVLEVLAPAGLYPIRNDLALIVCDRPPGIDPVRMAKFDPQNAPFTSIGFRRKHLYISNAQSGHEVDKAPGLLKFSAPAVPGMSGGGTFDRNGNLVGVCVGGDFDFDSRTNNLTRIGDWSVSANGDAMVDLVRRYQ